MASQFEDFSNSLFKGQIFIKTKSELVFKNLFFLQPIHVKPVSNTNLLLNLV